MSVPENAAVIQFQPDPGTLEGARKILHDRLRELPSGEEFLLSGQDLEAWSTVRDHEPDLYLIYRGDVRRKCGRGTVEMLDQRLSSSTRGKVNGAHQAPILSELRAVTLEHFLNIEIPIPEALLGGLITKQWLGLLYSWRGVGKTWFASGCAYAIASGGKFLRWTAITPQKVLYLDGEMPASALQRRLASIASGSSAEARPGFFNLITPDLCGGLVPDLATVEGQEKIDKLIEETGAGFVVVDNLSCWVRSGVENEAESWRIMAEWLLRHRSAGRAILLVHHAGKGGAQRGSSKKEDILDVSLDLRRPATYEPEQGAAFTVEFKKSRHLSGKDAESFEVQLTVDGNGAAQWTMTAVSESTYARIVEYAGLGLSQKEIAEELDIHKSNVSRHWRKAVEVGDIKIKAASNGQG